MKVVVQGRAEEDGVALRLHDDDLGVHHGVLRDEVPDGRVVLFHVVVLRVGLRRAGTYRHLLSSCTGLSPLGP